MSMKHNFEEKIERALSSMDEHTRATPGPYFATRIQACLGVQNRSNIWDKVYALISKPIIAIAGIAIILLVNILIITSDDDSDPTRLQADANGDWQGYSTASTTALYDVENIEP